MSERLAEVARRIETVRQLGAVVNAMRGIAGQRAQQARALLPAIRAYAETTSRAIGQARALSRGGTAAASTGPEGKPALIAFGAEQGFAGAYPEQLVDAITAQVSTHHLLLAGTRAAAIAAERGLPVAWITRVPGAARVLPRLALAVLDALDDHLAEAGPVPVALAYPAWSTEHGARIVQTSLLPLDLSAFPADAGRAPPLTNLPPAELIEGLTLEYAFARICEAAAEAFAAENEARMRTMASARAHIEAKGEALRLEERLTRQDEITAEVVELAAGARSRR